MMKKKKQSLWRFWPPFVQALSVGVLIAVPAFVGGGALHGVLN